jgi:DNA-binding winged helix-turn-helix (wHTH) protein/TolB-like protein
MSLEKFPDLLLNISDVDMRTEERHSYRFKSFILKPTERQLFDRDDLVALSPKAFDMLTLLVVNAGHLVTKEELLETIWSESFVEEANLARVVHTIRKALGEDENGDKFIETVPTKGYRFLPDVERIISTPREIKETSATESSDESWPDRLESAPSLDTRPTSSAIPEKKFRSHWLFVSLASLVFIGLVASFTIWQNSVNHTDAKDRPISIAVLPFRAIGPGEHDHYFDVAFANSLVADLNQSKNLRVRPFAPQDYIDSDQDALAVGKEREADYVIDSNYVSNGGKLQVTMNVINVRTQSVDFSFPYIGDDTDLYAAGPRVAAKIVPQILAKLDLPAASPGDHGTKNEQAWKHYYWGIVLTNRRNVEDAEKGVDEFNHAVRLDPGYAQAYVGLARALQTIYLNGGERDKYCPPAFDAEKKALELQPNLGSAMAAMAENRKICWYEIPESEELFQRALGLSPGSPVPRRAYAVNIATEGRFDEALEYLKVAQELEPNSIFGEKLIGRVLFQSRRYDAAIEQGIKVWQVDQEPEQASFIYMSYEMKKDFDNAFNWLLIVKQKDGESEDELNLWRTIYDQSGWQGLLKRRLERALEEEQTTVDINKHARLLEEITSLSIELGDYDLGFVYMEKAALGYGLYGGQMLVDPFLDPIRSDPRYKAILAKTWNSHGGNYSVSF